MAFIAMILGLFLLPRAAEGSALAGVAATVLALLAIPMAFAAVAFTADVIRGRYPRTEDR